MAASGRDAEYTRRVEQQLRVRCVHLLAKEAYTGVPSAHEREFEADGPVWWCDRTGEALGPDGSQACAEHCHAPGRPCYEPPVRL